MVTLRFDQVSIPDGARWPLEIVIREALDKRLENEPRAACLLDALSRFLTDERRPDSIDLPFEGLTDEALTVLDSEFTDLGEQLLPELAAFCDSVVRALQDARDERQSA